MYYYFPVNGKIAAINKDDATKKMNAISSQWEDETTDWGTLFMGVFDWAYSEGKHGIELHIPRLVSGESIEKNEPASNLFGVDIYGECFLKAIPSKIDDINVMIQS